MKYVHAANAALALVVVGGIGIAYYNRPDAPPVPVSAPGAATPAPAPQIAPPAAPAVLYGDRVMVRLYRGWTGKFADHATDRFALEAKRLCGIRFYVDSGQEWDEAAFRKGSLTMRAEKVVFVGTSLGGFRAREHSQRWSYDGSGAPVRLLLIDPVPWTNPIPKVVGNDYVLWVNTAPAVFGGGIPAGVNSKLDPKTGKPVDPQRFRPSFSTHGILIHSPTTRQEVAEEICRGVTHPNKRPK
jgi:hypothetical protein